ncbi:hypothetical protein [Algoriphagus persicinus]|uniref:hypothetical protein n=1 Tax=Algoriphagus persicinus TaxID=3108754 RepID=UPI002B36C460|nr:hypothetical protein [Algoriphagus sp. E1-3-M2]MEB2785508.1 hypothetical protein [Algoriphagus sp. E1-3-M2]
MENIVSGSIAGLIAGVMLICIQIILDNRKIRRDAIKGKKKKGILDENFLIYHFPKKITLEIVMNYFGGPNDVEDLLNNEKIFKYEFQNGILKFLIESNGNSISSVAFWYSEGQPVKCPNYALRNHPKFGDATFTKTMIDKGVDYWTFDRPRLGYSSISCYSEWVELSSIKFTYYMLESTQSKDDMLFKLISQVSMSYARSNNDVFIHSEEIDQFYSNYG